MEYQENGVRKEHLLPFNAFLRSRVYGQWSRQENIGMYVGDIDQLMYIQDKGREQIVALFELTSTTYTDFKRIDGTRYLESMKTRLLKKYEGSVLQHIASALKVPAYIVFYPVDMEHAETYLPEWFYVYSFKYKCWQYFTPNSWRSILIQLREYAKRRLTKQKS